MSRQPAIPRLVRMARRALQTRLPPPSAALGQFSRVSRASSVATPIIPTASRALFSTTSQRFVPLDPKSLETAKPAELSDAEYHEISEHYMENMLEQYEKMQDASTAVEVEYSQGVLNLTIGGKGTWVVNKQPPNKQIWLSSPVSGPKRYDYVVISEGQDQKQDTAQGAWVYLRDGSTLSDLLYKETGVTLDVLDA